MATADRTVINFDNELRSLINHEQIILRPRLSNLTNNVYIPKFRTKGYCAYIYGGETDENYSNYKIISDKNFVFQDTDRSSKDYVLGLDFTSTVSGASLVNSYGKILANSNI